jgi:Sulphur oxidation protein SoxZ
MNVMAGERYRAGIQWLRYARPRKQVVQTIFRVLSASVALWFALSGPSLAQDNDPDASPIWQKVCADPFGGTRIESGEEVLVLETPKRAGDAAQHFMRSVEVRSDGRPLLTADVDFSISENPNFRFFFIPGQGGELEAKAIDNQGQEFATSLKLDSARIGAVSTPQ